MTGDSPGAAADPAVARTAASPSAQPSADPSLNPASPARSPGFWALMGLAAVVGGVMRSPLTGVIFALELTHEWSVALPLTIAAASAYGVSALILKRSVLTEKVARKGFHLTREYSVDPLEILFVREVMRTEFISFQADAPLPATSSTFVSTLRQRRHRHNRQGLYPVLDLSGQLCGVSTRRDMLDAALDHDRGTGSTVADIMNTAPMVAFADETLRELAYRMADSRITHMPVVERGNRTRLVGMVSQADLLKGRLLDLQEERDVERVLRVRQILPFAARWSLRTQKE